MLTGKMVRVRYARTKIIPQYLDATDAAWLEVADRLLDVFRRHVRRSRGELTNEIRETFGDSPDQQVHQGLAKLLEDRGEFEVVSGVPPVEVRSAVFLAAAQLRSRESTDAIGAPVFSRDAVVSQAAESLDVSTDDVERSLYADLRTEQRLMAFNDLSAERLLQRYNVALAQAVLLRAVSVKVTLYGESPQRYRQLLRRIKFHRLMCEFEAIANDAHTITLDGPLSLFSATQKYGLQLALVLPAILHCKNFALEAELIWGPQRKPKLFELDSKDGLISHYADTGTYVPAEMAMFMELFHKRATDWTISESADVLPLGDGLWVPDYQLTHKESGEIVYLDVLGFWRKSSVEKHIKNLSQHAQERFVVALSDQLRVGEETLEELPAGVCRFRQMPLPKDVVKAAEAARKKNVGGRE